jgi:hypothetical protein
MGVCMYLLMKMQPKNETGIPAPEKRSSPPGPEAGKGEVKKATVIHLYNTNSSPLWQSLPIRMLSDVEEYLDEEYFSVLGGLCGAEIVIVLSQMDAESGIIALSDDGLFIDIPKFPLEQLLEELGIEDIEEVESIDPKELALKVWQYYQKNQQ